MQVLDERNIDHVLHRLEAAIDASFQEVEQRLQVGIASIKERLCPRPDARHEDVREQLTVVVGEVHARSSISSECSVRSSSNSRTAIGELNTRST